ncbi:MAG: hypothetical protein ABR906_06705 [Terracidiphilus sp.]|jgi:hypothetical protein
MQTISKQLRPAQSEVHRTAHDQDLIAVPKRAQLDREAEANNAYQTYTVPEPNPIPDAK